MNHSGEWVKREVGKVNGFLCRFEAEDFSYACEEGEKMKIFWVEFEFLTSNNKVGFRNDCDNQPI
jgi:hypothetical protein